MLIITSLLQFNIHDACIQRPNYRGIHTSCSVQALIISTRYTLDFFL